MNGPTALRSEAVPQVPATSPDDGLRDLRFRRLIGPEGWARLPAAVRRRFAKRLAGGCSITYAGQVIETRASRLGRLLAQLARVIGAPLPLGDIRGGAAAAVTVTEDRAGAGQFWTRLYVRERGFPQVIHSAKRFSGPTGLEELVGGGIGMALTLNVEDGALMFHSAGYFLRLLGRRLALPDWLTPGAITVGHHELGGGRFLYSLEVTHPRFGRLLRQSAIFEDAPLVQPVPQDPVPNEEERP